MGRRGPEPLYHEVGIHLFVFVAALVFVHSPADVPACLAEPLRKSVSAVGNMRLTDGTSSPFSEVTTAKSWQIQIRDGMCV